MVTVEQSNIRGLDIDKTVKGFALVEYVFKRACNVSNTSADSIRWYQETAADLTATAPSVVANVSPLSTFPTLEVDWTRNTSYVRKYAAEGFLSMEEVAGADIDVLARTLLRLTRAVVKQVDTRIWNVMTNSRAGVTGAVTDVNLVTSSGAWNDGANSPIWDILEAKKAIYISGNYNPEGANLYLSPQDYTNLMNWLFVKGSTIPGWTSDKLSTGSVTSFLGLNIVVSPNVTNDYAAVVIPNTACTWKTFQDTTSRVIEEPGIGSRVRVWEIGEGILTDPKAVCLISNTQ